MGSGETEDQGELFSDDDEEGGDSSIIVVNDRCRIQTMAGFRVVSVGGIPIASYVVGDRVSEAHAMLNLVEQGWARQIETARAFGCSDRTVRRNLRRFDRGGLSALGRPRGYPRGQPRLPASRSEMVGRWATEGVSNRQIARRLGVNEKAVRKLLRRLGFEPKGAEQISLEVEPEGADPKLSGSLTAEMMEQQGSLEEASAGADPKLSGSPAAEDSNSSVEAPDREGAAPRPAERAAEETSAGSDPKLSGSPAAGLPPCPISFDWDPADRCLDRVLASRGLLDDAAPLFRQGVDVPNAGVLLAIPALVGSGVFEIGDEVYGSIGPAFYGLRTTLVTFLLMALLRIKHPEALKEHSPEALGRIIGLDRAPEVKTMRRKLARLGAMGRAAQFGRALARRRVAVRGRAVGFLYCDGHVRAYHGKHSLPKAHLARMRLSMPATTDYWVNDADGEPLLVITVEANIGLVKALEPILDEIREVVGDRRLTVVFDRGGWSPALFSKLLARGFDILTYRKGRFRQLSRSSFSLHEASFEDREVRYWLADQGTYLHYGPANARKRLHLRQVTRLGDDGHQTPIITSRRDLTAVEVAYRMFERWRQENFFKYLRQEYALDALVDYDVEPADPSRDVPNPERKKINAQIRKAHNELSLLAAEYGAEAFDNRQDLRRTMEDFKKVSAPLTKRIVEVLESIRALEEKRATIPTRVPVQQLTQGEVVKLSVERKHLMNVLKMVAYQAETDLLRQVTPHYRRSEDEGRTLIQAALATAGDIDIRDGELCLDLAPLSSPHRTHALVCLCEELTATETLFPGTRLRLRFDVKPAPEGTLAFPGPRPSRSPEDTEPDSH